MGWRNFLWFSDIALITTGIAFWLKSALLASIASLAVLLPEMLWIARYFVRLLFGLRVTDLAGYIFVRRKPLFVRGLSLFRVLLPPVLIWMLYVLGYHPGALLAQNAARVGGAADRLCGDDAGGGKHQPGGGHLEVSTSDRRLRTRSSAQESCLLAAIVRGRGRV